jgi:hypothetical protein
MTKSHAHPTYIAAHESYDFSGFQRAKLIALWKNHMTERVPDHLPKSILAMLLAYRLQAEQHGSLSTKATAYLKVIETDLREGRQPHTPYMSSNHLRPGTQLVREHDGVFHRVTVLETGFEWAGEAYASLSAVATAITGTNWNGHRFFGLHKKAVAQKTR